MNPTDIDTLTSEDSVLENLNPQQLECVLHDKGPLLIVAGAGTGKTTIITRRIAYLVTMKKARPEEILALTFTDKAAAEMEERVDILVPYGYTDVWISTFHAFGNRVLQEHAYELGLPAEFRVLPRAGQIIFLKERLFLLPLKIYRPLGDPSRYLDGLLTLFSRAKDEDITPLEYLEYASYLLKDISDETQQDEAKKQNELAQCYKAYQELMHSEGMIDFGDQVALALRLFREHPSILKRYQERFKYILVDEFQDTNYAQYQLVKLLSGSNGDIVVCGDDDQSIYKFRGAAISNILNFLKDYPSAKCIVILENYRSTQKILNSAYRLIRYNDPDRLEVKQGVDKKLISSKGLGPSEPQYLTFQTVSEEADYVARLIKEKVDKGLDVYQDIAILVRSNKDAEPYLKSMNMLSIPWRFTGNAGLYSKEEIRMLIAFLHIVNDPLDSLAFYQLASSDIYNIPMSDLIKFFNCAKFRNRTLMEIAKNAQAFSELMTISSEGMDALNRLIKDIESYQELSRRITPTQLLYKFLKDSRVLAKISDEENIGSIEKVQNIARFLEILRGFEQVLKSDRLPNLISHLDSIIESGEDPPVAELDEELPAVNILTVHKAKGLEFSIVFMVGLVQGRFPVIGRSSPVELPNPLIKDILPGGDFHLQEERRLFYVGMTRAKDELYFTSSLDYGTRRTRKVSQFVSEALDLPKGKLNYTKSSAMETIERFKLPDESVNINLSAIPDEEILKLTRLQIDDYLTCPLKYKFIHILKVPLLWRHHMVVYGNAIHKALEEYFKKRIMGQNMSIDGLIMTFESVWVNEGFESRQHEEVRLSRGRQVLKDFYERDQRENLIPTYIEKEFKFTFDNNLIIGRWDRVDIRDGKTTIIDYKSSEVGNQQHADRRIKESIQMMVYAWAWYELDGSLPDRIELHFLESSLVGGMQVTKDALENIKERVREVTRHLRLRDFDAKPDYNSCKWCTYKRVCHYAVVR